MPERPLEQSPALRSFIHYRGKLAEMRQRMRATGQGNLFELMHWYNAMGQFRGELAPWEYIPCPDCSGQGLWVEDGKNHWCARCSGTGIVPVCELTDPAEIARNPWKIRYAEPDADGQSDAVDTPHSEAGQQGPEEKR